LTFEAKITMHDVKPHLVKPKYFAQAEEEFGGFIDYYSGHGHAFTKPDVLGCVTLQCWPTNEETWEQVGDALLEDQSEIEDLTEGKTLDLEQADNAVKAFIEKNFKGADKDKTAFPDWNDQDDESPERETYLLVLHIFEETT
jgi:hypothetical protein